MTVRHTGRLRRLWILSLVIPALLAGCDLFGSDESEPPAQIPPAAFEMDTNMFNQNPSSKSKALPAAYKTNAQYGNFAAAAVRVWPVSLFMTANLVVPAAATNAALNVDPSFENGSWVWSSNIQVEGNSVAFNLNGEPADGGTDWELQVTYDDPTGELSLDNFVFYTAETRSSATSGSWELFYPDDGDRTHVLDAEYSIASEEEKTITFSIPASAEAHAGDSVTYSRDGELRTFEWTAGGGSGHAVVHWNAETKAGSITAQGYNDGQKACWDANLENTSCPVL